MIGINSVTFRHLTWEQIVVLAKEQGLNGIEWGGDVHVPPGVLDLASMIGEETRKNGAAVTAYGSYYRLGEHEEVESSFRRVLETAEALRAPILRIWAGKAGSQQISDEKRKRLTEELRRIGYMAAEKKITVGLEYHRDTMTDCAESTLRLIQEAGCLNIKTYWQMNPEITHEERQKELLLLKSWICGVHVFFWNRENGRLPLSAGHEEWRIYLSKLDNREIPYTLEFVKNDSIAQLKKDIEVWNMIDLQYEK